SAIVTPVAPDRRSASRFPSQRRSTIPPSHPPPTLPPSDAPPIRARPSTLTRARTSAPPPPSRGSSGSLRAPVQGRIKGTAIRTGLLYYAQKYGPEPLARVAELASPELQSFLRFNDPTFGIVASGWYDTTKIGELLLLLER